MKKLYILGVAINNYPKLAHRLNGCINDRNNLVEYLQHRYETQFDICPEMLTDDEATRSGIINGFEHFKDAQDGDVCLFFYAGHGSQVEASEHFYHLEADRRFESLVCYDSRGEGGKDLLDKELSYLIWSVTEGAGKNIHFIAIMDCCHSGSNTRTEIENGAVARRVEVSRAIMPDDSMLGYKFYQKTEKGNLNAPRSRHILLAAAHSFETAKEVTNEHGQVTGAFTYSLLEALRKSGKQLSYKTLMNRVALRIKGMVRKQSPQLDSFSAADKDLVFLTGESVEREETFLVSYDRMHKWVINAGSILGITSGDEQAVTQFTLVDDNTLLTVQEVRPSMSKVSGMIGEKHQKHQVYPVKLAQGAIPKLKVAIATNVEEPLKDRFRKIYQKAFWDIITLSNDIQEADYVIHVQENQLWLSLPTDERPLFKRIKGVAPEAVSDFFKKLTFVARWRRILELSNPSGEIRNEEFRIDLYRITDVGKYTWDAASEKVDWGAPLLLPYTYQYGTWHRPAFRLKLSNTSHRQLWFSVLYLEDNFGVNNELLAGVALDPGQEVWLEDNTGHFPTNAIQVWLPDVYHQWGITNTREYLKVIVSTEDPETDHLNQLGLPYDEPMDTFRGYGQRGNIKQHDWVSEDIQLIIHKPFPFVKPNGPKPPTSFGVTLRSAPDFSAGLRLESYEMAIQSLPLKPDPYLGEGCYFNPYILQNGINESEGLSVVALQILRNRSAISINNPLQLSFDSLKTERSRPLPYGYDSDQNCFFLLKHEWSNETLFIYQLPVVSKDQEPKIEIFLHKEE